MKRLIYIAAALVPAFAIAQQDTAVSKKLELQEAVIREINISKSKPLTFSSLDRKALKQVYYGADVPQLLQQLPSINAYSDNGLGIGYSFFRLRGIDQTRINTTINGIPVNDPENQGVFFHNFADLLSGTETIQVQRGLGTSTYGTSAFGGSVQINTRALAPKFGGELNLGIGSFGSNRISAEVNSGLMGGKWLAYVRVGRVATQGFRNNSAAEVISYQVSLQRNLKKGFLRYHSFGGATQNQLSYLGIDDATYKSDPKTNPFTQGESDAFRQFFHQLQYQVMLNSKNTLSASAYLVRGRAPKFEFIFPESWGYGYDFFNMAPYINGNDTLFTAGDMRTSYCLDQTFMGAYVNHTYYTGKLEINSGVHANRFVADHFMQVISGTRIPAGIESKHEVYRNTGTKQELSAFTKASIDLNKLRVFADVQLRAATFSYTDKPMEIRPSYGTVEDMNWLFVNPRIGFNYTLSLGDMFYGFVGLGYREPTRFDYLQDDFAPRDVKQNEINPEQVVNSELGYRFMGKKGSMTVNAYFMDFKNQIVGTGALNNFGYAITGNVGQSWRYGLEIEYRVQLYKQWYWFGNGNMSKNEIASLTQTHFNTDENVSQQFTYKNTPLAFSPNQIWLTGLTTSFFDKRLDVLAQYRFVGEQYVDNTGNKNLKLDHFQTIDLLASYRFKLNSKYAKAFQLSGRVNNLLNAKYAPSGSVGGFNSIDNAGVRGQTLLRLPAAGINYFVTLSYVF